MNNQPNVQALDRIKECIDHADPNYRNQLIMVESDIAHVLLELLQDETEAVAVKSASVISAITDHCASSKVRLQSGVTALENQSCNILFNPVQDHFLDAIPILVPWTLDFRLIKSDTARETIGNITSFNKEGKLALIETLCLTIDQGTMEVIELLDITLAVLDTWQDDLINTLNPRCAQIMDCLKTKQLDGINNMIAALGFISTVCERSSSIRETIVENNGIVIIMQLLLLNDDLTPYLTLVDAAVNTLWQMSSKGYDKDGIFAALDMILQESSIDSIRIILRALASVIHAGDMTTHQGDWEGDVDSCQESGGAQVDYDEEAKKLEQIVQSFYRSRSSDVTNPSENAGDKTACSIM